MGKDKLFTRKEINDKLQFKGWKELDNIITIFKSRTKNEIYKLLSNGKYKLITNQVNNSDNKQDDQKSTKKIEKSEKQEDQKPNRKEDLNQKDQHSSTKIPKENNQ